VLLPVEDESTSVVNGALVGVLLGQSASPSVICLLLSRSTYLGFLLRENLLLYSSHLPLGVPNGLVIYHASGVFIDEGAAPEVAHSPLWSSGSFVK
jgi:hypothetical protein